MIEINHTINVPKNSFRIFTVDKDGNETGNSAEYTNTWTYVGLRGFWISTSGSISGAYAPNNGTSGASGIFNIYISDSTSPINKEFTSFDRDEYWVSGSSTRVSVRDGVNYDAREYVNINGVEYLRLRHLRSWAFGSINRTIRSVAIRPGNINTGSSMYAGRLLSEPFTVTDEEQVLVRYDVLIPAEYVTHTSPRNMRFGHSNFILDGNTHEVSIGKTPFYWNGNPNNNNTYNLYYASGFMNHNNWTVNSVTSTNNTPNQVNGEYLSGDNWRSWEWEFMIPPYPLGGISISNIVQRDNATTGSGPWAWNGGIFFDPPITKIEDERVIIKLKIRQEVNEYEP